MHRISYAELPAADVGVSKAFYEAAFGWSLTSFGPQYAATTGGNVDLGLDGGEGRVTAPFALIEVDDLEAAREQVIAAGGTLLRDIYAYPGGRRFHFVDPAGNELGVFMTDAPPA